MSDALNALTIDFLAWIALHPRTYAEAMGAWRTTCPRLTVWEDALAGGLIVVERGRTLGESRVSLTPRGAARLDGAGRAP